jgi:Cu(I)/Ag(I) efflux system membrane fusion protein
MKNTVLGALGSLRRSPRRLAGGALVLLAFGLGMLVGGGEAPLPDSHIHSETEATGQAMETRWTCSMHPQINLPQSGQCPICGMDLIPVSDEPADPISGERVLSMSESAAKLADIETVSVERKAPRAEIRMVGKIDYDESKLAYITAYFPGRLDRLFVDYTGIEVNKGDHLVKIYSPELLTAQEELIQAIRTTGALGASKNRLVRDVSSDTVQAAREKLRLWGMSQEQIADVERDGNASDDITIFSPISGVVIHKNAVEGMYVETGTRVYTLADLTRLWVKLDAYESDLPWLRYGEQVEFSTQSLPGETFRGRISFIDPVLTADTRTVKVRVNVPNTDGRLKPGMFVRAVARPRVASDGSVVDSSLAGKWISPMHPEIVKDEPGQCDICGMDLVRAEEFGLLTDEAAVEMPLVIPVTAPLLTGKRAVVYVRVPGQDRPTFEGREVVLGPRAGDYYIVREGLREGERVVTNGAFKIDSALQIVAKPSMMSPEGGVPMSGHADHGGDASEMKKTNMPGPSGADSMEGHQH